jgi:hypothetical protein
MARVVIASDPPTQGPIKEVVEEKKTTSREIPADVQSQIARPGTPGMRPKKPHINRWFASLPRDEAANSYSYTLYRDDPRIIIVEEELDERAAGSMLYKFTPDEIRALPEGAFTEEIGELIKKKNFGGGDFHLMVTMRKGSVLQYNKSLKLFGQPILSDREGWVGGQQPSTPGSSGDSSFLPMLMKLIDEKLAAVTQQRQDPNTALAEVTKVIMEANTTAYRWAMDNAPKPADPTAQLQQMKAMFELFKSVQPTLPAEQSADPMAQFTQFATMLRTIRELDAPRENPVSTKEVLVEAVKTAVREMGGPRGAPRGVDWGAIAEKFVPVLAPIGLALVAKLSSRPGAAPAALQPAPAHFQPQPAQPAFNPAQGANAMPRVSGGGPPRPSAQSIEPAAPPAPVAPQPAPAAASDQIVVTTEVQNAVLWDHVTSQVVDMLTHDVAGDVAAESLDNMFPQIAVHIGAMNEDALMVMIQSDAKLSQVKDNPRLPGFIKAFLGYFREEDAPAV